MEDIGKPCYFCRKQDFLPFECKHCHFYFCIKHRAPSAHKCMSTENCKEKSFTCTVIKYECEYCCKKSYIETLCPVCNLNFCVSHRHPEAHQCEKLEKKKTNFWQKFLRLFSTFANQG